MNVFATSSKHMRRSPYQAIAAILTLFVTLLLSGIFFLTTLGSIYVLNYFESKPQITVFFTDKFSENDIQSLEKTLEETGKVASTKYVSKQEALSLYREQNKHDPLLLEMVTADILPASLEVSAKDPRYLAELEPIIKQTNGVEEVVFQKDVVNTLIIWTRAIRLVGLSLATLLTVDSLLVVLTIIGMKIALRKKEVEILTLVGASPWYIRMPFVIEGGLYGVTGAVLAWIVTEGVLIWSRPHLITFLGVIPLFRDLFLDPFSSYFLLGSAGFLGILISLGFIVGSLGSLMAVGRYLKF